jgi:hypothetical protein
MPNSKTGHYEVRDDSPRKGLVGIEWVSPTERPLLMVTTVAERVPLLYAALGDYLKRRGHGNGEHPDHLRPRIPPDDQMGGKRGPDGTPPS